MVSMRAHHSNKSIFIALAVLVSHQLHTYSEKDLLYIHKCFQTEQYTYT